jgi:TPP-dependent pyruvate/acetoin dehydrogenase alpha subunit
MNSKISKKLALEMYKKMKLCRKFEEKVIELVNTNEIYGTTHEYIGQEAVAVGICSALHPGDYIMSTHRGHGHMIAKGGELKYMFAELMGKSTGYNCGKGGSMHIAEPKIGILGANGIVGGGVPIATGAALALKLDNRDEIVVSFYGDGASNQGVVHESMNMAAIWNLPILFVCENNKYAVSTSIEYSAKIKNLSKRAEAYGFKGFTVDGMDVIKVYDKAKVLVDNIRKDKEPYLLECKTYRYRGHFTAEPMLGLNYRTAEEIDYYKSRDPIINFLKKNIKDNIFSQKEIAETDKQIERSIEEAVDFAKNSNQPEPEEALRDMYSSPLDGIPERGW